MYRHTQIDLSFSSLNVFDDAAFSEFRLDGPTLLSSTALSPAAPLLPNMGFPGLSSDLVIGKDDTLLQTPAQSALADFSDNLQALETKVELVLEGISLARETAETIQDGLGIFGEIENAADTVADVMGGFRTVLKLVGKVGFLKPFTKKLDGVFKDMIDAVREIESRAKRIDEKLEDEQDFVEDMVEDLSNYETGVELALARIVSLRTTVDEADAAYNRLSDIDAGNNAALEASIETLFDNANMNYSGLDQYLSDVTSGLGTISGIFGNISDILPGAITISNQLSGIANQLSFLQTPMNILNDALSPVEWVLDAVEIVFNTLVAPILDPILEQFGIQALFDNISDALLALLPDTGPIFNIEAQFDSIFEQVNIDFITNFITNDLDITGTLGDINFELYLIPDFLNPVDNSSSGVIVLNEGDIVATGSGNADLISGNELSNTLNGGGGNDVFTPGEGNDTVNGGAGNDMVIFDASLTEFTFTELNDGRFVITHTMPLSGQPNFGTNTMDSIEQFVFSDTVSGPLSQMDLVNIDNVPLGFIGTYNGMTGDDFIIGNSEANSINGLAGNDFINGGLGNDELLGGDGNDILAGGGGADIINGGNGFDTASFAGLTGPVNVVLLPGAQQGGLTLPSPLIGNITNVERIIGSDGADRIYGDFTANRLEGGQSDDVLRGLDGDDDLRGDAGHDVLFGDLGNDTLDGGAGDDYLIAGHGTDTLIGAEGYDTAYYGSTVLPTPLDNILTETNYVAEAGTFAGIVHYVIYDGVAGTVEKFDASDISLGIDTLVDVERIYAGDGNNLFTGSTAAETMIGGTGDDIFRLNGAIDGEDAFFGGGGNDTVYLSGIGAERGNGGGGTNMFIYENTGELTQDYTLTINVSSGTDSIDFSASQYGLMNAVDGNGDSVDNSYSFSGTLGVTSLMDIRGIEILIATNHADEIVFGLGETVYFETVYGGLGDDLLGSLDGTSPVTLYGEMGDDRFFIGYNVDAYGGSGNDVFTMFLIGDGTGSIIELDGAEGDDIFYLQAAEAEIDGGAGRDTIMAFNRALNIHIGDSIYASQIGNSELFDLTLTGIENVIGSIEDDTISGSDGANVILGRGGDDSIYGLADDDLIFGGGGEDSLFGGDGDDALSLGEISTGNFMGVANADVNYFETVDGGSGNDTLTFEYAAEIRTQTNVQYTFHIGLDGSVVVDLDALTSVFDIREGTGFITASLANIENATGTYLDDILRGSDDMNTTNQLIGGLGNDLIWGFGGNDNLVGGGGDDAVDGGTGDDILIAGVGADRVYGGAGADLLVLSGADQGAIVDMTLGMATLSTTRSPAVWADNGGTEARNISYVDNFTGNTIIESLTPLDVFRMREENVTSQTDLERYRNLNLNTALLDANSSLTDAQGNQVFGLFEIDFQESVEVSTTTFSGIENIEGSRGDDDITGNNLDNTLNGGDGHDMLRGGLGNDALSGGGGDDIIYGDQGSAVQDFGLAQLNVGGMGQLSGGNYTGSVTDNLYVDVLNGFDGTGLTLELLYQASDLSRETTGRSVYLSYAVAGTDNEIMMQDVNGEFRVIIAGQIVDTGVSTEGLENGALHRLSLSYELLDFGNGTLNGRFIIYVDGIEVYNHGISTANRAITPGGSLVIGQEQDAVNGVGFNPSEILAGSIGDIRLWDSVRTATEIADNAFTLADNMSPDLIENWVFGSGAIQNRAGSAVMTLTGGAIQSIGTAGGDIIDGGAGDDQLFGGDGDDLFLSSLEDSDTEEEDPDNLIDTHDGADIFDGGAGVDTVSYENSSAGVIVDLTGTGVGGDAQGDSYISIERVIGTEFYDVFIGDDGDNIFVVTTGADDYYAGAGFDTVDYSASSERILSTQVFDNIELITGSDFNDDIAGGIGDSVINAGLGADRIFGSAGADVNNGGAGFDTMDYRGAGTRVVFDVANGGTLGDAAGDSYSDIERFFGSNFNDTFTGSNANEFLYGEDGNDVINGGGGIDRIYGGEGNDVQRGQDGNDTLYASAGADQLNGGVGTDVANYTLAYTAIIVNMATGGTGGDAAGDTYFGIEAIYGTNFDDHITGNNSTNELRGGDGDDVLDGAGGNDRLHGDAGADTLIGGTGIDSIYYSNATAAVTLNLVTGGTLGDATGDSYSGIEWVFGTDFDDVITGDAAANRLYGEDGNDTLDGGAGNDRLLGGNGNDAIYGGDGIDTLFGQAGFNQIFGGDGNDFISAGADLNSDSYDGGDGFDTVSYLASAGPITIVNHAGVFGGFNDSEGDTFVSIERILGTNFNDIMFGGTGNDIYFGYGGDDFMGGGAGSDSLFGGAGADTFYFDVNAYGIDVVGDFQALGPVQDMINLIGGGTDYDTFAEVMAVANQVGDNTVFDFGGGNVLTLVDVDMMDLDASHFGF